ncbi:MAG: poly-gamma-glutamate synthase PgsB [Candidatus Cloacimonadota bacterium]|nr:MAG: poly-gamma-glutamate synthase PgsB [Candidatus Cloacimonadota bacterium]
MSILILSAFLLIIFWIFEYYRHVRNVKSIPVRIHVNGTRGKSSVTRLIIAGLRAGGKRTVGKTTGTMPRLILEDGREASIERLFGANIMEQKYVFRHAAERKPEIMVIECMAVNPVFQWITERKFVQSTISVITNSRMDHTDLMGNTIESITRCLSNTIPENGYCCTSEKEQFGIFKEIAEKRNTEIVCVPSDHITPEDMKGFNYLEHEDNVALALNVCERCGVKKEVALKGMHTAVPDPGALTIYRSEQNGKSLNFYNVFAANDPDSTKFIYHKITDNLENADKIIILNSRADRYFRTVQLLEVCKNLEFDYLILSGERNEQALDFAQKTGIDKNKIEVVNEMDPEKLYDKICNMTHKESHIIGIGNIAGKIKYGASIVRCFMNKSKGGK